MKKWIVVSLAAAALCAASPARADWKESKGDHFVVYYESDESFARETLHFSEKYYTRIAQDLGYNRFNFWNWENRVKIYIYPDESSYQKATGQPAWSKGVANYTTKSIATFNYNKEFQQSLLPHEIAHLIFRDFVGFRGQVPLWLDEGVAQWQEPKTRSLARQAGYTVIMKRGIYPFDYFTSIYDLEEKSEKEVQFFYMQAVSVVDFLIQNHGAILFTQFCQSLRDGKSLDTALKSTYGATIPSLFDLEQKWLKYVNPNVTPVSS